MFGYYLDLALRSLKRNRVLTVLMVLAIAVGIGACMTTLTVVHLLSGDPIPSKSSVLFFPQVDPENPVVGEPRSRVRRWITARPWTCGVRIAPTARRSSPAVP